MLKCTRAQSLDNALLASRPLLCARQLPEANEQWIDADSLIPW